MANETAVADHRRTTEERLAKRKEGWVDFVRRFRELNPHLPEVQAALRGETDYHLRAGLGGALRASAGQFVLPLYHPQHGRANQDWYIGRTKEAAQAITDRSPVQAGTALHRAGR